MSTCEPKWLRHVSIKGHSVVRQSTMFTISFNVCSPTLLPPPPAGGSLICFRSIASAANELTAVDGGRPSSLVGRAHPTKIGQSRIDLKLNHRTIKECMIGAALF